METITSISSARLGSAVAKEASDAISDAILCSVGTGLLFSGVGPLRIFAAMDLGILSALRSCGDVDTLCSVPEYDANEADSSYSPSLAFGLPCTSECWPAGSVPYISSSSLASAAPNEISDSISEPTLSSCNEFSLAAGIEPVASFSRCIPFASPASTPSISPSPSSSKEADMSSCCISKVSPSSV